MTPDELLSALNSCPALGKDSSQFLHLVSSLADCTTGNVSSGYDSVDDSDQMVQVPLANDEQAKHQVTDCLSELVVNTSGVSDADLPAFALRMTLVRAVAAAQHS